MDYLQGDLGKQKAKERLDQAKKSVAYTIKEAKKRKKTPDQTKVKKQKLVASKRKKSTKQKYSVFDDDE